MQKTVSDLFRYISFFFVLMVTSSVALGLEITSSIRGDVTEAGSAVSSATIVVRNENTGRERSVMTNESGSFLVRNLPVDGIYTVTATRGTSTDSIKSLSLVLGQTSNVSLDIASSLEEVVVQGRRIDSQVAPGPNAVFGLETLESAPAINRNIVDILRIDPRVYVDEGRAEINPVQCMGKNPRFNSLNVDGVALNDLFGLNSNGYPTERMPYSYDAISQVAIEIAPFDVRYGGFTACNINAVTKSGSNEFSGSVWYDMTSDSLTGDSLEGEDVAVGDYDKDRYGFTLGGPILQDQLFFFVTYEKQEGVDLQEKGPLGSGAISEVAVTQAEIDEIAQISRDIYQYDPGFIPSAFDNEDEKITAKLDWYINDDHRLSFFYNYNDGFTMVCEGRGNTGRLGFSNHCYERGAELDAYTATLFSEWSDAFSTEIRIGYVDLQNRQLSVGGTGQPLGQGFGEIRIELDDVDVYIGGDDSRSANQLNYQADFFSIRGNYQLSGHSISFGIDRNSLDIYNLFVQEAEGELRFEGIENFRLGIIDRYEYKNAPSHNPRDAAADWGYETTSFYIQDEFDLMPDVRVVAGLRYDRYTTDDEPAVNPNFLATYGYGNNATLDGEGLLQPRISVTYDYSDALTFRAGIGKYSGGNPNVWLSNNYSSDNVRQFGQRGDTSIGLFDPGVTYSGCEPGVPTGPGWCIRSDVYDAVSTGTGRNFEMNALDPDFELPSEWKFSMGITGELENNIRIDADVFFSKGEDTAVVRRGDLEVTGFTAEGYPQFDSVREPAFILTNSNEGTESRGFSVSMSQVLDNGISWSVGYAYNDSEDVQPMTSSVAFSNYVNRASFDPQGDVLATSNWNIRNRFTGTFNYTATWFGDDKPLVISLFGQMRDGKPYSEAFVGTIDPYGFTPFLDFEPSTLRPGVERNATDGSWWGKVDMKIEQKFQLGPGQASAFMIIDNLTNLLNDDWGVLNEVNFPNLVEEGDDPEPRIGDASRYEIIFGVKYDF